MKVIGCDYSTRFVDLVSVPYEGAGAPVWHRLPLTGADAFDRTRSVADVMPGRSSVFWDDTLAVGIEHPGGHHGTRDMLRVQGAILSCLPARLLVEPWPPSKWRKAVGLAGNAPKPQSRERAWKDDPRFTGLTDWDGPPLDACDAYCIALATRQAITRERAA